MGYIKLRYKSDNSTTIVTNENILVNILKAIAVYNDKYIWDKQTSRGYYFNVPVYISDIPHKVISYFAEVLFIEKRK